MTMSDALALPTSPSASQAVNLPSYLEARMNIKQLSSHAHATAASHPGQRVVKRRASRACHYCRAKKIKCSVVKSGSPCNTCRLDEVECHVSPARRKRRPRVNGVLVDRLSAPSLFKHQQRNLLEQNLPVDGDGILASTSPVNVYEGSQIFYSLDWAPRARSTRLDTDRVRCRTRDLGQSTIIRQPFRYPCRRLCATFAASTVRHSAPIAGSTPGHTTALKVHSTVPSRVECR